MFALCEFFKESIAKSNANLFTCREATLNSIINIAASLNTEIN